MNKLIKNHAFDSAAALKQLNLLNVGAQQGRRMELALGLFCIELKEVHLKFGKFGPWLAEHRPDLARQHSISKSWQPNYSLESAMGLAKGALEVAGSSYEKFVGWLKKQIPDGSGICHGGNFLLLEDAKIPESVRPMREKLCAAVDGKSKRRLFQEFKQVEDKDDGTLGVKRGRLKGQGGASKEQRAAAAERAERERIEDLELAAKENTGWLYEFCDDKNGGAISEAVFDKFIEAAQHAVDYGKRVQQMRKGK